jgi:ATP-binding cassette subfamily B (MDR/TAP) protein 1
MASARYYATPTSEDVSGASDEHDRKQILSQQVDSQDAQVGFFGLYRYATISDKLLLLLSVACCIIAGAAVPGMTVRRSRAFKD